ncbi:imidazole glycerol phosphate synthase subunit HisH [Desulfomonile tiedjei]|uniref:Imidazole glycerol phosphate synthase subunit HisH n=1 Tax=Desulfomonile tiedjei (strain ATCC 49306 / DSM 6799 / DCB-1) TaxID=706587 RepID=I4C0M9_DESTA|nr:imidazole glycerol phosphate synthase subunit HisH [Desulfomonile tiedjei]AFM23120.1 imidazole glycerol phosphate synthase subunit hisH [Desulfomonile tiedjei DSM 6799]
MLIVVDYGMGNLRSVQKGFEKVGVSARISRDADEIRKADRLVLPGVGAFPECMKNLSNLDLVEPIQEFIQSEKPFLGICLGLQLLFDESEEFGIHEGFKVVPGTVKAFDRNMGLKIPHMGWNQVFFRKEVPIFKGISDGSYLYFVHSYYVVPQNDSHIVAESEYGITFTCAVAADNVFAVQFHPEKSQETGLKILTNFARL